MLQQTPFIWRIMGLFKSYPIIKNLCVSFYFFINWNKPIFSNLNGKKFLCNMCFSPSQRRNPILNFLKSARRRIDDLLTDRREIEDRASLVHPPSHNSTGFESPHEQLSHNSWPREEGTLSNGLSLRFAPAGFVNRRSTSRRIGSGGTCLDRSRNSREREREMEPWR